MFRAAFLDRDGTIARDVPYCRRPEDFQLFPEAARAVKELGCLGLKVVLITNQSGIGRGYFTCEELGQIHLKMHQELSRESAGIDAVYFCPHRPEDGCECRKPKPGMLLQAARELNIDLGRSYMIGDSISDVVAGQRAGCRTVLISGTSSPIQPDAPYENAGLWGLPSPSTGEAWVRVRHASDHVRPPPHSLPPGERGNAFSSSVVTVATAMKDYPDFVGPDLTAAVRWISADYKLGRP